MPKVSKESAKNVKDFGVAEDRSDDLDGYTFNFVTIRETHDLAPMLASLPGGKFVEFLLAHAIDAAIAAHP